MKSKKIKSYSGSVWVGKVEKNIDAVVDFQYPTMIDGELRLKTVITETYSDKQNINCLFLTEDEVAGFHERNASGLIHMIKL